MLTAEEFAKLTSQGVLKFHPPNEPPKSISTAAVPSAASIHTATVTIPTGSHVVVERPEVSGHVVNIGSQAEDLMIK